MQLIEGHVGQFLLLAAGPVDDDLVALVVLPQAKSHWQLALAEVALGGPDQPPLDLAPLMKLDQRADSIGVRRLADELQPQPVMPELLVVPQEPSGTTGRGGDDVEIAVAVDVGAGCPATDHGLQKLLAAFFLGHLQELDLLLGAAIPEEVRLLRVELRDLHAVNVFFQVAVGSEDVEPAIEIRVEEEQAELELQARGGA